MPPRIVLDTNLLIASIGRSSPVRWLFDALISERLRLVVSTPILFEYEEVLSRKSSAAVARNVLSLLSLAPNVEHVEVRFQWRLIASDPDDDKFVDALLAAGADAVVTHDKHFDPLKALGFPPVTVWDASELRRRLLPASAS